jgi:hypothetical protein
LIRIFVRPSTIHGPSCWTLTLKFETSTIITILDGEERYPAFCRERWRAEEGAKEPRVNSTTLVTNRISKMSRANLGISLAFVLSFTEVAREFG